jgi:putative heme-binding domain-containing protein
MTRRRTCNMAIYWRFTLGMLTGLICAPAVADDDALRARNDAIIIRAIERMEGYDYSSDEHVKAAIARHLDRSEGTAEYLRLVKRFRPDDLADKLAQMLVADVSDSVKVEAAGLLGETEGGPQQLRAMLAGESVTDAARLATIMGLLGNARATNMLGDLAADAERPYEVRKNAVIGLARNRGGEKRLLALAEAKQLIADTRMLAGGLLARSKDEQFRKTAARLLPQPQQKDRKPLAPIDELAKMTGNADRGMQLFRGVATCANCHIINKFGKDVGPDLSEIGTKLSREAMFTSILDPSAGISHNYENYIVVTVSGQVINGLKVSETPDQVVIRTPEGIDRKIPQDDIEQIKTSEKSIMAEDLHHTVDQQGLLDIVEYLASLKKK